MGYIRDEVVLTRKEHRCWGCAIKYPKGTIMKVCVGTENGKMESVYWCKTCQEYCTRYMQPDDEFGIGELRSEDREAWEALKKELEE